MRIWEEKVKRAEKIKDLVKGGISIDIILQAVGISLDEIQQI